jgi:ariadne-1
MTDMQDVDDVDPSDWFLEEEVDEEPMFTILEKDDLIESQDDLITSTATQLDTSPADAALILQYFDWDSDKLLYDYFDKPEHFQQAAGLAGNTPLTAPPPTTTCPVCLEDKGPREFHSLWCGHVYCLECWRDYLHQMASSLGPEIINVHCMYPRCPAKLNYKEFERLADLYDYKRFTYFFLKHYTESDSHMVICPNPACGNAAKYHGVGKPSDVVECHCGTRFCFSCGHEKHNPVTCEQLTTWLGQLQDDGESVAVIKATSKPCWHCGVATTRISGCNHMICRKEMGGCGGEWCWMCRGDWATHGAHTGGFYSCNKYETSEAKAEDEEAKKYLEPEESRKRLLHYYNRYFNHDVLMKNVQKMLRDSEVEEKMVKYTDITGNSPDFYLEAAELLVECRRVLKYTYVYGYYLQDGPGKSLFEYQQASAEGITERLSEMFHGPIEEIAAQPIDFVNYIRVTKKYITNLVRSVEEQGASSTDSEPDPTA